VATLEEQIELERQMLQAGVDRYQHNTNKLLEKGIESNTQHGRAAIAGIVNALADGVTDIQKDTTSNRDIAKKKLSGMDAHKVAYLTLVSVVDEVSKHYTLTKVARIVGMNVELQKRLTQWIESDGKPAKLDKVIVKTALVKLSKHRQRNNKTVTYLEATPDTLEWVRKFNLYQETKRPRYAPSIIPPKDWVDVVGGGYHSEAINDLPLVRVH
jgi:DNA-directed RNA polymerase